MDRRGHRCKQPLGAGRTMTPCMSGMTCQNRSENATDLPSTAVVEQWSPLCMSAEEFYLAGPNPCLCCPVNWRKKRAREGVCNKADRPEPPVNEKVVRQRHKWCEAQRRHRARVKAGVNLVDNDTHALRSEWESARERCVR